MAGQKFEEGETVMVRNWDKSWIPGTILKVGVSQYGWKDAPPGKHLLVQVTEQGWGNKDNTHNRHIWPSRKNILKPDEYNATIRPEQEARQRRREEAKQERLERFKWYVETLNTTAQTESLTAAAMQAAAWFNEYTEAQRDYEIEHPRTA